LFFRLLVYHDENQVKSTQERGGNSRVLIIVIPVVPFLGSTWISGCQDGSPRIDLTTDTGLGNTDGLLFHGLVDTSSILRLDQRKLVNAASTTVSQHESTSLQDPIIAILKG
jgi:hypothetical protein